MTDNVDPDTFTPNYTSRKRVTRPPMCTHSGSSFPRVITPFGQGRRVSRAPSQSLVPRSRSSFLIPDLTYRFITPSPPSEKEALLTPGIIYTIILLTLVRVIPVLKLAIVSKSTFKGGVAWKNTPENLYHAQGTIRGLPGTGTGVLPVVCDLSYW